MAQGKARDQRKEQQWRSRIEQWRRSGLSVRDFCSRQRLREPSFYAWRRLLRQRDDAAAAAFVAVEVTAEESAPAGGGSLEVVVAGGRRVRVAPGFDAATLRQLLAVLEEVASC
jgi:hypothetical protein